MKSKKKNIFMPKDHMDALYNSANPLVKFVHNQRLDCHLNHHSGDLLII